MTEARTKPITPMFSELCRRSATSVYGRLRRFAIREFALRMDSGKFSKYFWCQIGTTFLSHSGVLAT
jgi:hypothetical protein